MARRPARRSGFTLLEVLLASGVAVVLLGGLYVAFDLTLVRTALAREQAARADVVRGLVARMAADLPAAVGPLPPKSGGRPPPTAASASTATSTPTTGTTAATGNAATGSTSTSTSTSSSGATDSSASDAGAADESAPPPDVPFQGGVVGTADQLTVFVARPPDALADAAAFADAAVRPADLRRVTYYLGSAGGLCRQDRPWVLADGVRNAVDPDRSDEAADELAPEVVGLRFEYFDGNGWAADWDGTQANADGTSFRGPPRAVRAAFDLDFGDGQVRTVSHVFGLRAAVGVVPPPEPPAEEAAPAEGQ